MLSRSKSSKPSRRRAALEAEGLLYAPAAVQQSFWLCYNRQRRPANRPVEGIGSLVEVAVSPEMLRSAKRLEELAEAWGQVVPERYRARTRVSRFQRGRLEVIVDGTLRFALGRRMHGDLLSKLNERLRGFRVARICYRVGSVLDS